MDVLVYCLLSSRSMTVSAAVTRLLSHSQSMHAIAAVHVRTSPAMLPRTHTACSSTSSLGLSSRPTSAGTGLCRSSMVVCSVVPAAMFVSAHSASTCACTCVGCEDRLIEHMHCIVHWINRSGVLFSLTWMAGWSESLSQSRRRGIQSRSSTSRIISSRLLDSSCATGCR